MVVLCNIPEPLGIQNVCCRGSLCKYYHQPVMGGWESGVVCDGMLMFPDPIATCGYLDLVTVEIKGTLRFKGSGKVSSAPFNDNKGNEHAAI